MSTSSKGSQIERKALQFLEQHGYIVHRTIRTGGVDMTGNFFSHHNDVFGCIDLIAKKMGERTRWIQVTAHSGIGQKITELRLVPWDPQYDSVEIWRWVGGQHKKHKTSGKMLYKQYFQIYHLDDNYELIKGRRIYLGKKQPEGWINDPLGRKQELK